MYNVLKSMLKTYLKTEVIKNNNMPVIHYSKVEKNMLWEILGVIL